MEMYGATTAILSHLDILPSLPLEETAACDQEHWVMDVECLLGDRGKA